MSDSEGDITKNISLSNYSSNFIIISEVTYPDIAAPVITPVYPASGSSLSAGTTETLINISTNESAECRYDLSNSSFDFANGTLFNITGNQSHSFILLGLSNGNTYTLYYKCNDSAGNINSASTTHTFSVSNPSSGGSSGGGGGGGGGGSSCTSNWSCTNWSACIKDSQERACIDLNKCGGNFGKPDTKQKCQSCIENWACTNWTECSYEGVQVRACTDGNLCGTSLSKPSEIQTCKKPDCNDKIQNQGEFGVDCGGPCAKRCEKIVAGGITGKMLVELEQPQENKSALKYSIFLIFLSLFVGVLIFVSRIETKIKEQKLAGHVNFKKMHFKLLLAHILHAIAIIAIFIIIILIIIF